VGDAWPEDGAGGRYGAHGGGGGGDGRGGGRRGVSGGRPGARPPLRLTRRGRLVVVVLTAIGMCTAFSVGRMTSSASAGPAHPQVQMRVHVVEPGETLWGIARDVSPDSDTRVVVAWLSELNRLASPGLVPGQVLLLP
jgi:hypothetical protein